MLSPILVQQSGCQKNDITTKELRARSYTYCGPGAGRAISTVCRNKERRREKKVYFHKPIFNTVRIQAWSDPAPERNGRDKIYFYTSISHHSAKNLLISA